MSRTFDSLSISRPPPFAYPAFDSGLPACRSRATRRMRVDELPPEMKPLYFASEGSDVPPGSLHVTTRSRSIRDVAIPADRELTAHFGVRCAPTLVKPVSPVEVELMEGESP